jgi:hypothetical protein
MEPNFIDDGTLWCVHKREWNKIRGKNWKMRGLKKFQVFNQKMMMIQCNLLWKNCMKVKKWGPHHRNDPI